MKKSKCELITARKEAASADGVNPIDFVFNFSGALYENCVALERCLRADIYRDAPLINGEFGDENDDKCVLDRVEVIRDEITDEYYRLISVAHSLRNKAKLLADLTGHHCGHDWVKGGAV